MYSTHETHAPLGFLSYALLVVSFTASADTLPPGMSLVALHEGQWHTYVVPPGRTSLALVPTATEPRDPDDCVSEQVLVYVAADGAIREVDVATGDDRVVLVRSGKRAYMQPTYAPDCTLLYVVELADGTSQDTDIVRIDRNGENRGVIVAQRSAQFDPFAAHDGRLYYGSVACVVSCDRIIKEIWRIDPLSGVVEQLSLVNSVAQEPVLSPDNTLYFSSDRNGDYHLWSMPADPGGAMTRLTAGEHTDVSPAVDRDGTVYFVRRAVTGTELMRLERGDPIRVSFDLSYDDLRDLKIDARAATNGGNSR